MSKYLLRKLDNLFHFISQDIKNIGIDITENERFKKATKKLMKNIIAKYLNQKLNESSAIKPIFNTKNKTIFS